MQLINNNEYPIIIIKTNNNNMNSEFDSIIELLNSLDFPFLLGIFSFISAVIIWGIIKNH
ncbi:MAG TPA: hypothetical protein VFU79_02820 [Nitrososphaeraceae archaeon]|nr:hypothetical protein [Nitrososphaeraceae archaeon]